MCSQGWLSLFQTCWKSPWQQAPLRMYSDEKLIPCSAGPGAETLFWLDWNKFSDFMSNQLMCRHSCLQECRSAYFWILFFMTSTVCGEALNWVSKQKYRLADARKSPRADSRTSRPNQLSLKSYHDLLTSTDPWRTNVPLKCWELFLLLILGFRLW